eukprot:173913-Prymnesium_polylepis.1
MIAPRPTHRGRSTHTGTHEGRWRTPLAGCTVSRIYAAEEPDLAQCAARACYCGARGACPPLQ